MRIFVISLKDKEDRRKQIASSLGKFNLPYEIVDAVNGRELDREHDPQVFNGDSFVIRHNFLSKTTCLGRLSDGELGCAMSHLKAYEKIVKDGLEHAIILEDDMVLSANIELLFTAALAKKACADVINAYGWPHGVRQSIFLRKQKFYEENGIPYYIQRLGIPYFDWWFSRRRRVNCAGCYLISKKACETVLKYAYPVRMESDVLIGMLAFNHFKYYGVTPFATDTRGASSIGELGGHGHTKFV